MTEFGELHQDGTHVHTGTISQADVLRCPHYIMHLDHFRTDGSCRCNDPESRDMEEWGYKWVNGAWQ